MNYSTTLSLENQQKTKFKKTGFIKRWCVAEIILCILLILFTFIGKLIGTGFVGVGIVLLLILTIGLATRLIIQKYNKKLQLMLYLSVTTVYSAFVESLLPAPKYPRYVLSSY